MEKKTNLKFENILTWFSYENMLQIIELDSFNILSFSNVDYFTFQEILNFENINFSQISVKNNLISNKFLLKEYIFDKENKFFSFLKSSNIHNNKSQNNIASNINGKNSTSNIIKKEKGKFLTELKPEKEEKLNLKFEILKENLENLIFQFIKIEKINFSIDNKVIERSYLFLGEEETTKILDNFRKAHELSYIKYSFEYKETIKNLIFEINYKNKNFLKPKIKKFLHNINFLYRSLNLTYDKKDNFVKRISMEFPQEKKEYIIDCLNVLII